MSDDQESQPTLAGLSVPTTPRPVPRAAQAPGGVAETDPVVEVAVDSHLAHLDRPFEYSVPARLAEAAQPGVRVRVRFAGRSVDGFVLARKSTAEHTGRLTPLLKVVSDEVVLTPHLARLCRDVADHYAGTLADVLRLAIPPRHARAEKSTAARAPTESGAPGQALAGPPTGPALIAGWESYPAGGAMLRRIATGEAPAAAWTALPDAGSPQGWPAALASAVAAAHASGRGAIVVTPDHRDLDRLAAALDAALGADAYVRITADLGPEQRYSAWLRALRGHTQVVIGSRSAAFAPVQNLGLVAWWDDGDDNLQEPRAPYPHVREILRRRAGLCGAGLIVGGYARTPQVQSWVRSGHLRDVTGSAVALTATKPRVVVAGEGYQGERDAAAATARLPSLAWRAVKEGLATGPVLVQVPRRGYLVALSCHDCRAPVRCTHCAGPLRLGRADGVAECGWCARPDTGHPCRQCGGTARRSRVVGDERTAEEVGRAFPGVRVVVSRAGQVVATVDDRAAVVIATPGAEPVAAGGYAATLLLDGWALLDRGGLDSGVEALRRWMAAAALSRPAAQVVLIGVPPHAALPPVEALVRWDPVWLAAREVEERLALLLPPARRAATVTGDAQAVAEAAQILCAEPYAASLEVLGPLAVSGGPTPEDAQVRLVVRERDVRGDDGLLAAPAVLPTALRGLRASRSLRKESGALVVRLDPADLDL